MPAMRAEVEEEDRLEAKTETVEVNMLTALNLAMDHEMAVDERVMIIGQDIGADGGIFRVTDGTMETGVLTGPGLGVRHHRDDKQRVALRELVEPVNGLRV
jgi:hypothetical protein